MLKRPWLMALLTCLLFITAIGFNFIASLELRWGTYQRDARARGVKLLLTDFAQPEIPDDRNFAALPLIRAAIHGVQSPFTLPPRPRGTRAYDSTDNPPMLPNAVRGESIDWKDWRQYFQEIGYLEGETENPAADVLLALDQYAPQLAEWSQWRSRPECHIPLDLTQGAMLPMTYLSTFQGVTRILGLRLRAHLATGNPEAAFADFEDIFYAYRALEHQPTLITGLVRISILAPLIAELGDGLREHQWPEAQLQRIQAALATIDVIEDYRLALSSERGAMNVTFDTWAGKPPDLSSSSFFSSSSSSSGSDWQRRVYSISPKSIIRVNQWRVNRCIDELLAQIDPTNTVIDIDHLPHPSAFELNGLADETIYLLSADVPQGFVTVRDRYITMHARLDQARLACALERYYLAHGSYPAALTGLVPTYLTSLPSDAGARTPGVPYHYTPEAPASFHLYGVGLDGRDDGGILDPRKRDTQQQDEIWLYAPPPPK